MKLRSRYYFTFLWSICTFSCAAQFMLGAVTMEEDQFDDHLEKIAECGFNTVELTQYAIQKDWNSADLIDTASIERFEKLLRSTSSKELDIVFVPRVHLDSKIPANRFLWHGMILPTSEDDIINWFEVYGTFVLKYAALCERHQVKVFAIGSELNALVSTNAIDQIPSLYQYYLSERKQWLNEGKLLKFKNEMDPLKTTSDGLLIRDNLKTLLEDKIEAQKKWAQIVTLQDSKDALKKINTRRALIERQWNILIKRVREVYTGKLCYAGNFDNYQDISFWSSLDVIGINAYFPLSEYKEKCKSKNCISKQASVAWTTHLNSISNYQRRMDLELPVLFTEIGYTKYKGSSYEPWKADGFSVVDGFLWDSYIDWELQPLYEDERIAALESLHKSVRESSFPLIGIMYWQISSDVDKGQNDAFVIPPKNKNATISTLRSFLDK